VLENGRTEVFWGHTKSFAEANARAQPSLRPRRCGWKDHTFEVVELVRSEG
jgi:hypothetical protein